MKRPQASDQPSLDDMRRALDAARARVAALSAAILRTNASLDLATVLQEAVDAGREASALAGL